MGECVVMGCYLTNKAIFNIIYNVRSSSIKHIFVVVLSYLRSNIQHNHVFREIFFFLLTGEKEVITN
jgi:hypothetical protein